MQDYRLEPAHLRDTARLAAMSGALIESGLRPRWGAERISRHVCDPESVVLTARSDRGIAGFAVMCFGDDAAHLNLLAVEPAHRRRGIARRLLTWLEESALTAGTFTVGLELRAGNAVARAFYAALGYLETGEVPGYYQGREAAIRLTRDVRVQREAPGARQASS